MDSRRPVRLPHGVVFIIMMTTDLREAATIFWGDAGTYVYDCYQQLRPLFPNLPDTLPIVIGLSAYGKCSGITRANDPHLNSPRISIATQYLPQGTGYVKDVMLHKMIHTTLHLSGRNTNHNGADWYAECQRLAQTVLGHPITLVPYSRQRKPVRVPNPKWTEGSDLPKTIVRKVPRDPDTIQHPHAKVAGFPPRRSAPTTTTGAPR